MGNEGDLRPLVLVGRGQRPHEIMLLFLAPIFAYQIVFSPATGSATSVMPRWEVLLFALVLAVSGVVGLVGCVLRESIRWYELGLAVEGGALTLGAGGLLLFTGVLGDVTNWRGIGWLFTGAWFCANIWRGIQCVRELRQLRRVR